MITVADDTVWDWCKFAFAFFSNIFWPMFVETHKLDKCAGFNDKSLFAAKEVYHNYHSWSDFDLQSPAYIWLTTSDIYHQIALSKATIGVVYLQNCPSLRLVSLLRVPHVPTVFDMLLSLIQSVVRTDQRVSVNPPTELNI